MFSQTTINEVVYKKRIPTIAKEKIKDHPKLKAYAESLPNAINRKSYKLLFNNTESLFFEIKSLVQDENKGNRFAAIRANSKGGTIGKFYVNMRQDTLLHQTSFRTDLLLIKSKVSDLNWQIDFETSKKVGEYTCFKATTSKKVLMSSSKVVDQPITAWFCPELPYPFGPTTFAGLPGLILELEYYDKTVIYADKISLNKKNDKKQKPIKPLKKGIKVTNQEYIDFMKKGGRQYKRSRK
jgi:GLPGLI family protein